MKRINLLYIFWILAFIFCLWIMNNLRTQGNRTIFGIAFTESHSINVEYATTVTQRMVQPGDRVKKGDTLLVLRRDEINKNITDRLASMNLLEVERISKNQILDKEIELFKASQTTRSIEVNSQIKIIEKEIEIQKNLLKSIGENSVDQSSNVKQLELAALVESLKQLNLHTIEQLSSYETQRQSNDKNQEAKKTQFKNEMDYYQEEQYKMIVCSPCDGIVENVFVLPNDIAPQYKELLRINSNNPNRVTGFIHESIVAPFKLGDTVILVSAARLDVTSKGVILGNGNNLVELPLRLRKFVEIRAWGREVYIKLDAANNFYIGEKILIRFN